MKLSSIINEKHKPLKEMIDRDEIDDISFEYKPYNVLCMIRDDENLWTPLIEPSVYKQALTEFIKYGQFMHFPAEKYIDDWWRIIIKNTRIIESITELAGHTQWFPTEDVEDFFGEEAEEYIKNKGLEDESSYKQYSSLLDDKGYYDKMVLPDGSNAWSDYGLRPLYKIINEYDEWMTPEEVLVLINRALDVIHQRGDLASAFIKGGSNTLSKITNEGLILSTNDIINESEELDEMAYPTNFDLKFFTQLRTFKDRVAYCRERLPLLGNGSSRIAFGVDDEKVLKIAKNTKGLAQNEHECDWGRNGYGCFAEIFEADTDNYKWLEMEIAHKVKKSDVPRLMGVTFEELYCIIELIYNQYSSNRKQIGISDSELKSKCQKYLEEMVYTEENQELYNLYLYMTDYQPEVIGDWRRLANWGIVVRNGKEHMVIIDDGLNDAVYDKYYK